MTSGMDFIPFLKKKFIPEQDKSGYSKIFKILEHEELLKDASFGYILKNFKDHIMIPENDFNNIYQATINKFAEFIQSLPSQKHENFNFKKGHLFLALLRTSIALEESNSYPCPIDSQEDRPPVLKEKRLAIWQYAIFSSALLLDLSLVLSNYIIQTCKENLSNKTLWLPIDGPMTANNNQNTHYTFKIIDPKFREQQKKLNLVLAKLIVPDHVYSWMYTEQDIFFEWLSLLEDHASGSGTLHKLAVVSIRKFMNEYGGLHLPDHILKLIPHHLKKRQEYHKNSFWKGVEYSLKGEKDLKKLPENNIATEFLEWLKTGIKSKVLTVNQKESLIHLSKDGIFLINPDIFIEFSKRSAKHSNWQTLFKELHKHGVIKYFNSSVLFQQKFNSTPEFRNGIIIEDPQYIFGTEVVPSMSPLLAPEPLKPIQNSAIFPTPREEAGAYLRRIFNPYPKPNL